MNDGESGGRVGRTRHLTPDDDVVGAVVDGFGGGCDPLLIAGGSAAGTDAWGDEDGVSASFVRESFEPQGAKPPGRPFLSASRGGRGG